MNEERNREYFKDTFSEIEAPSALVGKVLNMTANNEKKARPEIVKKVVIIAAALTLVLAATLVTAATVKFDFFHEVPFGNQTLSVFGYDPETGESEMIAVGKLPDEEFIFDLPALIDADQIPIPEGFGFEPSVIYEMGGDGELVTAEPRYYKHVVNLYYDGKFTETDENGEECTYAKSLGIHINEVYKNTRITVMHEGEMNKASLGDFEVYYYREGGNVSYVTLGEKYCIKIEDYTHGLSDRGSLTLEDISAILEAIDSMIYPE